MSLSKPSPASIWLLAASLMLALLAGCATVQTSGTPAARSRNEAIVQADALARQAATQSGAQRAQTEKQIESLLAALDDATLQREAAALPAGDPLYNYAGRALL